MNILLDGKEINFTHDDFPMLISGADKTGTSFFSICLLANIANEGHKVLLFSAYPAAKEEFRKHIKNEKAALIIESGDELEFIERIKSIDDLAERIILIKNIEAYSYHLLEAIEGAGFLIFSGDLDKCKFADNLLNMKWATKIFFSPSLKYPEDDLTDLPKYCGRIFSQKHQGIINLDIL